MMTFCYNNETTDEQKGFRNTVRCITCNRTVIKESKLLARIIIPHGRMGVDHGGGGGQVPPEFGVGGR